MITRGPSFVFGVPKEVKRIEGLPAGKVRLRFRPTEPAHAYVRTVHGCEEFVLVDHGEFWQCGFKTGCNLRPAA